MRISDWSSDLGSSDLLAEQSVYTGLPSRAAVPQMLHRLCVQADFDFHLGGFRLGTSAPRRLHPDHEDGIHRRVVVVNFRLKLGHNRTSLRAFQIGKASCRERGCQYVEFWGWAL